MKKAILPLLALLLFLSGCSHCSWDDPSGTAKIVANIHITYENGRDRQQWQYLSDQKMRPILDYLHWIDPYGKPNGDPDRVPGAVFRIVLHYTDGTEKVYCQKADQYMQVNGGPWLTIDPEKALTLSRIVGELESDKDID